MGGKRARNRGAMATARGEGQNEGSWELSITLTQDSFRAREIGGKIKNGHCQKN